MALSEVEQELIHGCFILLHGAIKQFCIKRPEKESLRATCHERQNVHDAAHCRWEKPQSIECSRAKEMEQVNCRATVFPQIHQLHSGNSLNTEVSSCRCGVPVSQRPRVSTTPAAGPSVSFDGYKDCD